MLSYLLRSPLRLKCSSDYSDLCDSISISGIRSLLTLVSEYSQLLLKLLLCNFLV
ncbi:hypothetical protein RNJ44_02588 [Nakaseomyces bracarensis]|uniref:Uncharacterized protein n=1 Tax=Nakaseomyces bracarensis TaxID=273131 RepID=A0ABR4NM45_9SACH